MGGKPDTALATAVVPFSTDSKMEEDLRQLMQGVMDTLAHESCELIGGHSCEGPDIALGKIYYGNYWTCSTTTSVSKYAL